MKNVNLFVILIALIICFILLVYSLLLKKNMFSNNKNNLTMELYVNQLITESLINNNIEVSFDTNKESSEYFLKYNITEPLLVLRYSAYSCKSCVDFSRKKVQEYFSEKNLKDNVLFLVSDCKQCNISIDEKVILLHNKKLGIPIEETNQPFLFVLKNNVVNNIFIPDIEYPIFVDIYLKEVIKRYFEN